MPLANRAPERQVNLGSYFYGFTAFDKKDSLFSAIDLLSTIETDSAFAFANYKYSNNQPGSQNETNVGYFRFVENNGSKTHIRINQLDLLNSNNSDEIIDFVNSEAETSILFKNESNQNVGFFIVKNAILDNSYISLEITKTIYYNNFVNDNKYSFDLNFLKKSESQKITFRVTENTIDEIISEFNNASTFNIKRPENLLIKAVYVTPQGVTPFRTTTKIYSLITKTDNVNDDLYSGDFGINGQTIKPKNICLIYSSNSDADDVEETPGSQTIYFDDIGSATITDHVSNLVNSITINPAPPSGNLTIIKVEIDNKKTSYIYKGNGGTYGLNDQDLEEDDIELLEQETEGGLVLYKNTNIVPVTQGGFFAGEPATPESGLTVQESIDKLLFPAIKPILDLSISPQPEFNQLVNYDLNIDISVEIKSVNAIIDTLKLEWKRSGGSYSTLTEDTTYANSIYTHTINSVSNDNIIYRLTVKDTKGAEKVITETRTVQNYSAPSGNLSLNPNGNVELGSDIVVNASVSRNRQYAIITNAKLQKRINNGSWETPSIEELSQADLGASFSFNQHTIQNSKTNNKVDFRILVTDNGESTNNVIASKTVNMIMPQWKGQKANGNSFDGATYNQFNSDLNKFISNNDNTSITVTAGNYGFFISINDNATIIEDGTGFAVNPDSYQKNTITAKLVNGEDVELTEYIIPPSGGDFKYNLE